MGIIAAVAAIGVGVAGAAGAFDPDKPPLRSLPLEVQNYLNTQGPILASRQRYLPQYADLYEQLAQKDATAQAHTYADLLPGLTTAENNASSSRLASQVGDYNLYSPELKATFEKNFPEYTSYLNELLGSAKSDLDSGYQLSPAEQRNVTQNARAAYSARGLGNSQAGAAGEAIAASLAGQNVRQQRLQNSLNVLGLYRGAYPTLALPGLTSPGQAAGQSGAFGLGGASAQFGAGQFGTPFNQYGTDIYDANLSTQWDYNKTIAAIRAQSANQIAGGVGSAGKAYGGGGFGGG